MSLQSVAQSLQPDAIVSLFTFDATSEGGPVLYFVQGRETNGDPIVFGGITYQPVDCEFSGLEVSGMGALPTPRMKLANHGSVFQSLINTYGDMLGCTLMRVRTFARFLDNGSAPDPNAYFGPDMFRVERKSTENSVEIEWELSASIDQEGKQLPGRTVVRDTCMWRYRRFDPVSGTFDYAKAQCPYVGSSYFDINDEPVADPALDKPSRRISCCEKRFGVGQPLPFGGFPGVARVRG